jgi:GNAT superfamily N-acetyltransferase
MGLQWVHESPAVWDDAKARILGTAAPGVFKFGGAGPGELLPGDWWHVLDGDRIVGFGWMDINWADGEILVAVDPAAQRGGVGSFVLARLEDEARARGVNYLYNVIPPAHPEPVRLAGWLEKHGYVPHGGGLLRAAVARHRHPA